ncbi:IS66 family transposase, partial [Vibrio jasicida]|uniref:IS66 family transposase n=1 Tax=Vibrio jasicida TaxID=766224 RepID=UPI0012E07797
MKTLNLLTGSQPLFGKIEELEILVSQLTGERDEFKQRYYQILDELRLARHRQFGASSDIDDNQGQLFDLEVETEEPEASDDEVQETPPSKSKPKRCPLPKDLPRVVIRHEPEQTHCSDCGHEMHSIGEDISEKLVFIPARVEVEQHVRPKCVCRQCEQQGESVTVYQAAMPATVFPKSIATPSLVAQMVAMKFQHGLPLTRISSFLETWDIHISRRTIADWVMQGAAALECVWEHLRGHLLKEGVIHADETPVKVIDSDKSQTYMWVYCSGSDGPVPTLKDDRFCRIVFVRCRRAEFRTQL